VSRSNEALDRPLGDELAAVEEAAGARLRAEADGDGNAAGVATEALLAGATSAMAAGYSLGAIAHAEARGKAHVKEDLHDDALKRVERSGRQMREAAVDHHRAIARAVRLGLSMREVALVAGVTHGTIRAISNRLVGDVSSGELVANEPPSSSRVTEPERSEPPSLANGR
jgi:hypothetical protein